MDSRASISELNYPTYVTFAKLLNIKQTNTLNSSKTLTVANQTEVPLLYYVTITLNTTIEDNSRQFIKLFAVSDMNYNNLGTFFEEFIQYKLNTNLRDAQNIQNLHHSYPKSTRISCTTYTESILKHKDVWNLTLPR